MFVLPVGWNWDEKYLWLLPNKIRPYPGLTFTSMPSGIVEVQNHSLGGQFPKFAFTLWQVRINNYIFSQFSLIVLIMPRPTPIGIKREALALVGEGMWQSTIAIRTWWVWLMLPPTTSSGGMCHWNFGARQVHGNSSEDHTSPIPCFVQMVWQDLFISARALTARMRNLYGMRAGWKTINNRFLSHGYRAYRPTKSPC